MIKFLEKYKEFIMLLVIAVLLILNIINSNTVKTDVKQYQKRFDYIENEINGLKKLNQVIDDRIINNNKQIEIVNNKIESIDKTIQRVKKNTDEKIGNVDNLKPNELELFFTNRYK
jgi:methyl-accepting chemotaxis protein